MEKETTFVIGVAIILVLSLVVFLITIAFATFGARHKTSKRKDRS